MNETERLHGFLVKRLPEKPEFLTMTQEEFEDRTLQAWSGSDEDSRVSAALRGGEREWELLWNDESYKVRGAVACRAGEKYQLRLVGDEVGPVRKRLAVYGTDRVRLALIEHGEADPEVIENIAKFGNTAVRHRLVDAAWGKPQLLTKAGGLRHGQGSPRPHRARRSGPGGYRKYSKIRQYRRPAPAGGRGLGETSIIDKGCPISARQRHRKAYVTS